MPLTHSIWVALMGLFKGFGSLNIDSGLGREKRGFSKKKKDKTKQYLPSPFSYVNHFPPIVTI